MIFLMFLFSFKFISDVAYISHTSIHFFLQLQKNMRACGGPKTRFGEGMLHNLHLKFHHKYELQFCFFTFWYMHTCSTTKYTHLPKSNVFYRFTHIRHAHVKHTHTCTHEHARQIVHTHGA